MSILNYLLKRNQDSGNAQEDSGYYDQGFWNYGNTDPSFWGNPQDANPGAWGTPDGFSVSQGFQQPQAGFNLSSSGLQQNPFQGYSLLDILSQFMSPGGSFGGW